jgi:hypothetical protein
MYMRVATRLIVTLALLYIFDAGCQMYPRAMSVFGGTLLIAALTYALHAKDIQTDPIGLLAWVFGMAILLRCRAVIASNM